MKKKSMLFPWMADMDEINGMYQKDNSDILLLLWVVIILYAATFYLYCQVQKHTVTLTFSILLTILFTP